MKNNIVSNWIHSLFLILLCVSLSGCFLRPYRFTVTQGNEITPEAVSQLQVGMSAEEVRYIMGTPLLNDVFHENRWDYIYTQKPGYEPTERYHVAILFKEGYVTQIMREALPDICDIAKAPSLEENKTQTVASANPSPQGA